METGLEGKPAYYGLIAGLVLGAVIWGVYHFALSDNVRNEISDVQEKISELEVKISEGESAKAKLPQFRQQVAALQLELDKLLKILPKRRNTQDLIRRIRVLTDQAGFNLKVFDPAESEADREFYKEWPIKMDLDGGYHELALFFDRISNLSRIINIENLQIIARDNQSQHTITARFTAKTFVDKEDPPPAEEREDRDNRRRRGRR
ncbi:MAG: type 4a pilus biogenesis protein PilO [Acidobacteriota bacterium]